MPTASRLALRVEGLVLERGDFRLSAMDWSVAAGELVGIVGVNGAGKTTFMHVVAGWLRSDGGQVHAHGRALEEYGHRLPEVVGFVPDTLNALEELTVRQHCTLLSEAYPNWDEEYATTLAERLRVPLTKPLRACSRGTRAKAGFMLVEAARPDVLLLDEPTAGLDPIVRQELLDVLREISQGSTERVVLFSTHLLDDIVQSATHVALVRRGQVLPCIGIAEVRREGMELARDPRSLAGLFGVESFE
jgi:ABC-2 type transport system ATP-binding protein